MAKKTNIKKSTSVEVEKKPKDRVWVVPFTAMMIAVLLISGIVFRDRIPNLFARGYEEPFEMYSEDEVIKKAENGDEFFLFIYGEDCPYCKDFMFGDVSNKSGTGPLKQFKAYEGIKDIDFGAFWTKEGDGFEGIETYIEGLEDKFDEDKNNKGLSTKNNFDWRNKKYSPGENTHGQDSVTTSRPSVPSLMYFEDGILRSYLSGSTTLANAIEWKALVDATPVE